MIWLLLRLPIVAVAGVVLLWLIAGFTGPGAKNTLLRERDRVRASFDDSECPSAILPEDDDPEAFLPSLLSQIPLDFRRSLSAQLVVSQVHLRHTLNILPVVVPLVLSGVLTGLFFRERLRYRDRIPAPYASTTTAYLAKFVFVGSLLYFTLFALTPIGAPYWTLYLAALSSSMGAVFYAANMPLKL